MTDFSYQLYSSRNFPPLGDTLRMLADLGYAEVEGFGALFGEDAQVESLRAALAETGLRMPTAHFGFDLLATPDRALRVAEALGVSKVYCPFVMPDDRPTDKAGWTAFGEKLAAAGRPVLDAGLKFGWHNHDFEFAPVDGAFPMDLILLADAGIGLELDVAWVVRGGQDPLAWMSKYADRITSVHVKDIAPAGENADEDGWADVGQGTLDWAGLMKAAEQTAAEHFIMEHDNPSDHQRFAQASLAYMTSL